MGDSETERSVLPCKGVSITQRKTGNRPCSEPARNATLQAGGVVGEKEKEKKRKKKRKGKKEKAGR
jgi:hypothetical protein